MRAVLDGFSTHFVLLTNVLLTNDLSKQCDILNSAYPHQAKLFEIV